MCLALQRLATSTAVLQSRMIRSLNSCFPGWLQPIVENQPISRLVYAMRALAGDSGDQVPPVTWSVIWPALAWLFGIIAVTLPWAVMVYRGRN